MWYKLTETSVKFLLRALTRKTLVVSVCRYDEKQKSKKLPQAKTLDLVLQMEDRV